jgi:hypothetical protein
MAYSDWQLNRLRDALRAYHAYTPTHDLGSFNWKDVSEAISLATDVKVPPERLRQFVEGNRSKDGGRRKFQSMQPESLEAIVKFVTEERLLSQGELEEHAPPWQAAQRLLEYLDQSFDKQRVLPPATFGGSYQSRRADERGFCVQELTLQKPSDEGLMQVTKTEEYYPAKAQDEFDKWTLEQRRKQRRTRTLYGGWAIFTPEDNVMAFLKQADTGRNLYQFTLAADKFYEPGAAVEQLILLHHDYPVELETLSSDQPEMLRAILQEAGKNILFFRRLA